MSTAGEGVTPRIHVWKRASDIRRIEEQSGVHAYRDQSDTRAMRGGPVARSMSGRNVPVPPRGQQGN